MEVSSYERNRDTNAATQLDQHHRENMEFKNMVFKREERRWTVTTVIAVIALVLSTISISAQVVILVLTHMQ